MDKNKKIIIAIAIVLVLGFLLSHLEEVEPETTNNTNTENVLAYTSEVSNVEESTTNEIIMEEVNSEEPVSKPTVSDYDYPSYLKDIVKNYVEQLNDNHLIAKYSISPIGNSSYSIYLYANKYYDEETYKSFCIKNINDLLIKINEKEYKAEFLAPKKVVIVFYICGYGRILPTKEINNTTQPLGTFSIYTDEMSQYEDFTEVITNRIEMQSDFF